MVRAFIGDDAQKLAAQFNQDERIDNLKREIEDLEDELRRTKRKLADEESTK